MVEKAKVAIITGSARGIGRAAALALAKKGIIPVVVDIDAEEAAQVVEEIAQLGITTTSFCVDVSCIEGIVHMIDAVAKQFGHVDILVNNAGILSTGTIGELEEAEWERVMNINVKSIAFASQQAYVYMKKQNWGRIINISSVAGRMGGYSAGCAYATSKAAIHGMTFSMARSAAAHHVTVNAIAPGPIETDILKGFTPEQVRNLELTIPVRTLGKPENIAETIVFLASEAAGFITGAVIDVNGGIFMG